MKRIDAHLAALALIFLRRSPWRSPRLSMLWMMDLFGEPLTWRHVVLAEDPRGELISWGADAGGRDA